MNTWRQQFSKQLRQWRKGGHWHSWRDELAWG